MPEQNVKLLLDTDIGSDIDDAIALAYLLSQPRCDLLGVTTVTGRPEQRAEMVSAICRAAGRDDVPIHAGCGEAMLVEMRQKTVPQAEALGEWDRQRDFAPATAVEFLRRTIRANAGEVTLLTIGPLTNVGVLFALDPDIPALLRRLVLMCGRFFEPPGGEWNAICDPHATAVAYGAGLRARPPRHVSFGLDVTTQCVMAADRCREQFAAGVLGPVRDFAEVYFRDHDRIVFHDPLAAACVFEPDLCTYREGRVRVSLSNERLGWTVFDEDGCDAPHIVAADVDPQRFFDHYFDVVR
jgi:inosine-uridine nucleoside N-ribohydrolase